MKSMRSSTLRREHGEPVVNAMPPSRGFREETRRSRVGDDIGDEGAGVDADGIDREGVVGLHAEGGAVDDEIAAGR
jgi:hypothetical protein